MSDYATDEEQEEGFDDLYDNEYDDGEYDEQDESDAIKDRLSILIGNALGPDYEDQYEFDNDENTILQQEFQNDYNIEKNEKIATKISVKDKFKSNKQKLKKTHQSNNHRNNNNNLNNESKTEEKFFKVGNITVSETKARLLGLNINDLEKKFNDKKKNLNYDNILPEPKSENIANHKNNNYGKNHISKKSLKYSKEDDIKNCIFKPKEKSASRIAAAKAAGFTFSDKGGDNGDGGGGGGFRLKDETYKDKEIEKEKLFIRRQDAFINVKQKELSRIELETAYSYILDCDKKKCPNCGNIQSYEEIEKKEKHCKGEYCNHALYTKGITFNRDKFFKRQEKHLNKSEEKFNKLKNETLEEEMKHYKPYTQSSSSSSSNCHETNNNNNNNHSKTTSTTQKQNQNSNSNSKKRYESKIQTKENENNVIRDLRTPRYLSRTFQQQNTTTNFNSSSHYNHQNQQNNENNNKSNKKYFIGNTNSTRTGSLSHQIQDTESKLMLQHIEEMVGTNGCDDLANQFVTNVYKDVINNKKKNNNDNIKKQQQTEQQYHHQNIEKKKKRESSETTFRTSHNTSNTSNNHERKSNSIKKNGNTTTTQQSKNTGGGANMKQSEEGELPFGAGLRRKALVREVDPWASLLH
mmetsp:Transcript_38294/g.49513  ORF Transcript_38294/g.49513 Transcript_38294/m.49513 type:complete len:636 (-) Transcript_38294:254-2161(-)